MGVPYLDMLQRGGRLSPESSKRFIDLMLDESVMVYDAHEVAASCLCWYQRPFRRWLIDWTQGTHVLRMKVPPKMLFGQRGD